MSLEELLPTCVSAAFRRGFNTTPFQNVPDRVVCHVVTEVGQCSLYPSIAPRAILLSHADSQSSNVLSRWRPARTSISTLRVLHNQFSVPRRQSLRRGDRRDLLQRLTLKLFRFGRQSPTLIIGELQTLVTDLFSKDPILLHQICDHLLLMAAHPAGNRRHNKRKSVEGRPHRR